MEAAPRDLIDAGLVDAIRTHGPVFFLYGFPVRTDILRLVAYFPTNLAGSAHDRARPHTSE